MVLDNKKRENMEDYRIYSRITRNDQLIEFKYSPEDEKLVSQHTWRFNAKGYVVASLNIEGKTKIITLHRLVMNSPTDMVIDHIYGDKTDNTRPHLRVCTNQQNCMNRKVNKNNTSGHKGVNWHKRDKKWRATIYINGEYILLLSTPNKEEALEARKQGEIRYQAEYRRL